ncbi:MAG: hypothetical protein PHT00_03880 [Candidatus Methanomethylophilus sp.]|nr:hypothetical protein [Methanomethylophilus sp.]MDD3233292.1 hypothetical protein [Methanomethylophilus sp.]MDD4221613.1 hypothetical protein [Methanomethylophilus sp.]MDD4669382.1 hypothetical protein [Methanomethylophilus sp.]
MPEDDSSTIVTGDRLDVYCWDTRVYSGHSVAIFFNTGTGSLDEKTVELGPDQVICEPTAPSFYIKGGSVISILVTGENVNQISLADKYVDAGVTQKIQISSTGLYEMTVYTDSFVIWNTVSYKAEGVAEPSGIGTGGEIAAVVLIAIAALIAAGAVLLRTGPKWAK